MTKENALIICRERKKKGTFILRPSLALGLKTSLDFHRGTNMISILLKRGLVLSQG